MCSCTDRKPIGPSALSTALEPTSLGTVGALTSADCLPDKGAFPSGQRPSNSQKGLYHTGKTAIFCQHFVPNVFYFLNRRDLHCKGIFSIANLRLYWNFFQMIYYCCCYIINRMWESSREILLRGRDALASKPFWF